MTHHKEKPDEPIAHPVTSFQQGSGGATQPEGEGSVGAGDLVSREAAARLVDAECARILSKQDGIIPSVDIPSVDTNLRLIASVLPAIAAAIRALPLPNADQGDQGEV